MQTLEQLLLAHTLRHIEKDLTDIQDPGQWTLATRDQKIDDISSTVTSIVHSNVDYLASMISSGKIYHTVTSEVLAGLLDVFIGFRNQLDTLTDEELKSSPFDYMWLTETIKNLYSAIESQDLALETSPDTIESHASEEL